MKSLIVFIITISTLSVFNPSGNGSEISQGNAIKLFTLANEEYTSAQKLMSTKKIKEASDGFKKAADQYEELLKSGYINGQVYYNLANTYYRQGKTGKAMLFYKKASKLMPRNSELKENIKLVKTEFDDKKLTEKTPGIIKALIFWYFIFNLNEATVFTLSFYIVSIICILAFIFFRLQWLRSFYIGFGIAMIVTGITLGAKIYTEQIRMQGIVISQECNVRYGPGEEYEAKLLIHEGAEFVVKDEKDEWFKVYVFIDVRQSDETEETTKELRIGWLPKDKVGII
ncbi:MAG: tetratricopeptide repeat protein [Candidatus Anammoxibacter sp.]